MLQEPDLWLSHLSMYQNCLQGMLKGREAGPSPHVSDSGDAGWGPGISLSSKFPGDTDVAGARTIRAKPMASVSLDTVKL